MIENTQRDSVVAKERFSKMLVKCFKTASNMSKETDIPLSTCSDYMNKKTFANLDNLIKIKRACSFFFIDYSLSVDCI